MDASRYFNNLIKDGFSKTSSFDLNKNEVDRLMAVYYSKMCEKPTTHTIEK